MAKPVSKAELRFRVLGSVELAAGDAATQLPGDKPRAVLAFILVHPNEVVSRDRLIDALWGERPPPTAAAASRFMSRS